ncbi:MAG: 30S ribosomal protein S6, partial [Actinobacteria bacterium]|nr:30S ribosomal protein S6 [Actinomycetota bacterium]MCL5674966.1 30S ribosomal protein S6 [Candidatus Omnitrophota bacterium]
MLQKYEAGLILSPEIAEEKIESELENIENEIISTAGSPVRKELWGKRNFSYPVQKKKEGYYCFFHYQTAPSSQKKIEDIIRGKQNILRSLFIIKTSQDKKIKSSKTEKGKEQNAGTKS